jgi:hypothetical protein
MGDGSDMGVQYGAPSFQGNDMGAFGGAGAKTQGGRDDFYGRAGSAAGQNAASKVNAGAPAGGVKPVNGGAVNGAPRFEDANAPYYPGAYNSMLLQQPGAPFGFSAPSSSVGSNKPQAGPQTVRRP